MDLTKLKDPFNPNDIEWRIQRSGINNGIAWAIVLPYVQARAVQERLDVVCGAENWKDIYQHINSNEGIGVMCGISIKAGEEWVEKWNGSPETDIESFKGGISKAFVRCGVNWGIGRYLYSLPTFRATSADKGKHRDVVKDKDGNKITVYWDDPELPTNAIPEGFKYPEKKPALKKPKAKSHPTTDPQLVAEGEPETRAQKAARLCSKLKINAHDDFASVFEYELNDAKEVHIDQWVAMLEDRATA